MDKTSFLVVLGEIWIGVDTMRVLQAYKSKKYLLQILMTITVLMVILLSLSSTVLHYLSEQRVLQMQQEANRKVMNQINYNISYMQEIVKNIAVRLYADSGIAPLINDQEPDSFDIIKAMGRLNSTKDTSNFLHSIMIYNGHFDKIYAIGEIAPEKEHHDLAVSIANQLKSSNKQPQMQLIPMNISHREHSVDFFSLFIYENFYENNHNESVLVLNVKPEWIFDNLKAVNDFAAPNQSDVFLMDEMGQVFFSSNPANIPDINGLKQAITTNQMKNPEEFGFFTAILKGYGSHIVTYMDTGMGNWKVYSVQPLVAVLGDIYDMRKTSIVVIVCFLALSVIVSIFMANKLYKPVRMMIKRLNAQLGSEDAERNRIQDEMTFLSDVYSELAHKLDLAANEQDKQKNIVRNYHLRSMLSNSPSFSKQEFSDSISQNNLRIRADGPFLLVVMKVDHYLDFLNQISNKQRMLYNFAILNITEEIFSSNELQCETVDPKSDHLVAIISKGDPGVLNIGEVTSHLSRVQAIVQSYYKLSISITISEPIIQYEDISKQYGLALQLALYKLLFGKSSIITPDKVQTNIAKIEYDYPAELEKKLVEAIKTNHLDEMEHSVHQLLAHISTFQYDHIVHGIMQIADTIKSTIREINKNRIASVLIDLSALSRQALEKESLEEVGTLFLQVCQEFHDKTQNSEQDKNAALIDAIKEIVTMNYMDTNISLQAIASMLKMTPAYVGRMFKQSEFISVGEFINEVRLSHAKEYLETKSFSIKEIMELVGFFNESTFFKQFKKKYGVTPKEYRLKQTLV